MKMKRMTYGGAINAAIKNEMTANENVFCLGEDIGIMGGSFGVTRGLLAEFGEERVIDTPISEALIVGASVGAAAVGMVPVAEIMFGDFMGSCFDQLLNQAAKMRYMNAGRIDLPMVVRFPTGGGIQAAAQHSQSLEGLLAHIPGLKVVFPSTPSDAYGLMLSAIRDNDPVMFFEHKVLYGKGEKIDLEMGPIPLGKARVFKEGSDVTVVATGMCVSDSLSVAKELEEEGVSVEVIDPRTLYPLDKETIYESVEKTGRLLVVTEENKRGAWSAELASLVAEEKFDYLKKPIARLGSLNVPAPFSGNLEEYVLPSKKNIKDAIQGLAGAMKATGIGAK